MVGEVEHPLESPGKASTQFFECCVLSKETDVLEGVEDGDGLPGRQEADGLRDGGDPRDHGAFGDGIELLAVADDDHRGVVSA
ncbi:hypothetical protein [Frigoribacterium sp. NBH87]|uniref:hypothetical protein n=1 Tax=Frigoribacterium sp. NBH87 TaxID=2596916 RepID=UPI002105FF74|nr:hypothetical protein [Frigoribacterium sp. NBH87]